MKVLLLLSTATCLLCATSPAEPGQPPPATHHTKKPNVCDLPDTPSITACSDKAQSLAEQKLNATYQLALKASEPEDQEKLRNVQRLWLQYREAECHVESDANSTLKPAFFAACVAQMDKIRTAELKDTYLR